VSFKAESDWNPMAIQEADDYTRPRRLYQNTMTIQASDDYTRIELLYKNNTIIQ
jgi:hypothetical protein